VLDCAVLAPGEIVQVVALGKAEIVAIRSALAAPALWMSMDVLPVFWIVVPNGESVVSVNVVEVPPVVVAPFSHNVAVADWITLIKY
jgi:hypothetical protein